MNDFRIYLYKCRFTVFVLKVIIILANYISSAQYDTCLSKEEIELYAIKRML